MNKSKRVCSSNEEEFELRRGPWTLEEDKLLIHYITFNGEGRWNFLAKCAGLKRTGKSCRLRWLNYLKPDIKRGNLTPQEQILILELHAKWGNRWSKIAQHLPGRTDNEIKNYWRTRVQKQARQFKIDSNSKRFIEELKRVWMPRLVEKMEQNSSSFSSMESQVTTGFSRQPNKIMNSLDQVKEKSTLNDYSSESNKVIQTHELSYNEVGTGKGGPGADCIYTTSLPSDCYSVGNDSFCVGDFGTSAVGPGYIPTWEFQMAGFDWINHDEVGGTFWNMDDQLWQYRQVERTSDG